MGYTTDFIGHIDVSPPLNADEIDYLTAFTRTRHCDRPGGSYAVSANPYASEEHLTIEQTNAVPAGMPGYWCAWEPYWDGCCLAFNGNEKFYDPVPWLRFLIKHFLKPGAVASRSGQEWFEGFTFDHRLDGMVVACRRDNKELFAINVRGNRVTEKVLRSADARYLDYPPLPYEEALDQEAARSSKGKRGQGRGPESDNVVPFPSL